MLGHLLRRVTTRKKLVGRRTTLGFVFWYAVDTDTFLIACNCGVVFACSVDRARKGSLGCKRCNHDKQSYYGKIGKAIQLKELAENQDNA